MKTKSLLAWGIPVFVLVFVVLTVLVSVPAEPWSLKACRQVPGCVAVHGWPSIR